MPINKDTFVKRARDRSESPGDRWAWLAGLVENKPGIGITDRKYYNSAQWNTLTAAKAQLTQPWE